MNINYLLNTQYSYYLKQKWLLDYFYELKTKEENQIILDARIEEWLPVDRGES